MKTTQREQVLYRMIEQHEPLTSIMDDILQQEVESAMIRRAERQRERRAVVRQRLEKARRERARRLDRGEHIGGFRRAQEDPIWDLLRNFARPRDEKETDEVCPYCGKAHWPYGR